MNLWIQAMLMHQRIFGRFLLALYFLLSYNGIQGETKLSQSEDLEMEKQLKLLNKPAVKTIKVYSCAYNSLEWVLYLCCRKKRISSTRSSLSVKIISISMLTFFILLNCDCILINHIYEYMFHVFFGLSDCE